MVIPAVLIVFWPINATVGIILAVACYLGICLMLWLSSPVIEIDSTTLRVGSARVPLRHIGDVTAYADRDRARMAAGPELDARAWTCLRGWAPLSVRVEISDPLDPVPYWLFSTRRPVELQRELKRAAAAVQQR